MALLKELKGLLPQLTNAKFMAHLLDPVLLWGVFAGVLAWIISLWVLKNRQAQVCSLILLAVSAFCIFPVMHYRTRARPISAPSTRLLNEQNDRRRETQWVYYTMGALAVLGIFMTGEGKGKLGTLLTILITGGGLATVVFSLWLQEKEISIFHEDARRTQRAAVRLPPADGSPATHHSGGEGRLSRFSRFIEIGQIPA